MRARACVCESVDVCLRGGLGVCWRGGHMGGGQGGMGGFGSMGSKELRQQPYPVDVISSQLYNRLGGVPGGGHEHQHR